MHQPISQAEMEQAYFWFQLKCGIEDSPRTIKEVRLARQKSMRMMATKLGISVSAYSQLERKLATPARYLKQLERIANALDCELKISIVPKGGETFTRGVWNQILPFVQKYPRIFEGPQTARPRRLAAIAVNECLPHPEVRRRLGWARKNYVQWPRYLCWDRSRWPYTV